MATSEIDDMTREGLTFVQRLKQAAVILANRHPSGLSRRDRRMLLQQWRYQQRLEAFEADRARTWYGDRVENYRQQSAHVAALHRRGKIDTLQRMQASTYLSGLRESLEASIHHTHLSGIERGQVVQALDGIDRDPFQRRQVFRPVTGHDAIRARYAAAKSEYESIQREQAARSVVEQAAGRDRTARISRGEVTDLDVARQHQRNAFLRDYFETYGHPVDFDAAQVRPWERAGQEPAQELKPFHASVTAGFDPRTGRDETRIEAFANGKDAIGWMREQLREPGIDRATVELSHAEAGSQFRFVKGSAAAIESRLSKLADQHEQGHANGAEQTHEPVDRTTALQARIDQLEADNQRLLGERDEAVRKLVARTPKQDRYGSGRRINGKTSPVPEQGAEQAQQQTGPVRSH